MYRRLYNYHGIKIKQSSHIWQSFPELFRTYKINRILEIGTYCGGLSYFLTQRYPEKEYLGYEIDETILHPKVNDLNIKTIDVFDDIPVIEEYIKRDGLCLVLCDGGDKFTEFKTLSPFLKKGDIIMSHDYLNDEIHDISVYNSVGLRTPETTKSMLRPIIDENNLTEAKVDFTLSVWGCFEKL